MSLTIVATAGSASANSYITLADAETYFLARPGADAWNAASDTAKTQALVAATMRLDQEEYTGSRAGSSQSLKWPRSGLVYDGVDVSETAIPVFLQRATCEEALAILADPGKYDLTGLEGFTAVDIGPLSVTVAGADAAPRTLSPVAARLLAAYRVGGGALGIRVIRA